MSDRVETVPPPPATAAPALFRWLSEVRAALGLEPVRSAALANGWAAHGAYAAPGYWKRQGMVHLTGAVQGGTAGTAICVLPAGFRPAATVRFEGARVEVDADGNVTPDAAAGNTRIGMDGLTFRAGG